MKRLYTNMILLPERNLRSPEISNSLAQMKHLQKKKKKKKDGGGREC